MSTPASSPVPATPHDFMYDLRALGPLENDELTPILIVGTPVSEVISTLRFRTSEMELVLRESEHAKQTALSRRRLMELLSRNWARAGRAERVVFECLRAGKIQRYVVMQASETGATIERTPAGLVILAATEDDVAGDDAAMPRGEGDAQVSFTSRMGRGGLLADHQIAARAQQAGMISPFEAAPVRTVNDRPVISYGLSSYGYDARLAPEFKIFTNVDNALIDPKSFDPKCFVDKVGDTCIIPPHSFVLGRTVESFRIPRDVLAICLGKSTYARCGLVVNVTPLEPEWEGHVTLEISNTTPLPAKIYAHEGICQFLFLQGMSMCETSYADRGGKYQGQSGITVPKL